MDTCCFYTTSSSVKSPLIFFWMWSWQQGSQGVRWPAEQSTGMKLELGQSCFSFQKFGLGANWHTDRKGLMLIHPRDGSWQRCQRFLPLSPQLLYFLSFWFYKLQNTFFSLWILFLKLLVINFCSMQQKISVNTNESLTKNLGESAVCPIFVSIKSVNESTFTYRLCYFDKLKNVSNFFPLLFIIKILDAYWS